MNNVQELVVNGVVIVSEKKKYASPETEVINLDYQPKLLSASDYSAGFKGVSRDSWDDEE